MFRRILTIISLLAYTTIANGTPPGESCKIPNDYLSKEQVNSKSMPLFLDESFDQIVFRYPIIDEGIIIPKGKAIYLACPGEGNYFTHKFASRQEKLTIVCVKDTTFKIVKRNSQSGDIDIKSLTCATQSTYTRYTGKLTCPYGKYIQIGFSTKMDFIRTIELCFDDTLHRTYMTYFHMSKSIGALTTAVGSSDFKDEEFFPEIDLDYAYNYDVQLKTISNILEKGSSDFFAKNYLQEGYPQYLSRGHLVAKADFVYPIQQRSTFWYVNTAPQWLSFNIGNWNLLERSVRLFARTNRLNLDVYTGVSGSMSMKDVHKKQVPVYLSDGGKKISVPKFFWKIIYDPLSKRGTAFVGLNDPFIETISDDEKLCPDISEKIKWPKWSPERKDGFSYACNIADLRKKITSLPPLDVTDILM